MPTPLPDPRQLRADTLAYIRAHPDEWDQESWRCGTGMCYAGTAAMLAGGTFPFPADALGVFADLVDTPDGRRREISDWAAQVLGLDWESKAVLFDPGNTLGDLTHIVARIDADLSLHDDDGFPLRPGTDWADLPDAPTISVDEPLKAGTTGGS